MYIPEILERSEKILCAFSVEIYPPFSVFLVLRHTLECIHISLPLFCARTTFLTSMLHYMWQESFNVLHIAASQLNSIQLYGYYLRAIAVANAKGGDPGKMTERNQTKKHFIVANNFVYFIFRFTMSESFNTICTDFFFIFFFPLSFVFICRTLANSSLWASSVGYCSGWVCFSIRQCDFNGHFSTAPFRHRRANERLGRVVNSVSNSTR